MDETETSLPLLPRPAYYTRLMGEDLPGMPYGIRSKKNFVMSDISRPVNHPNWRYSYLTL